MPKTSEGNYFLDVNPDFFQIVLDWLRVDKISSEDSGLLKGVYNLANYLKLDDLMEEINNLHNKKKSVKDIPEMITLHFPEDQILIDNTMDENYTSRRWVIKIRKSKLTRVPKSLIARYFSYEKNVPTYLFPIVSTNQPDHYIIDRKNIGLTTQVFEFFNSINIYTVTCGKYDHANDPMAPKSDLQQLRKLKNELKLYGIFEPSHYKVHFKGDSGQDMKDYDFEWNPEFILKYTFD